VLSDLLEHAHGTTVAKTLGPDATRLPNDQAQRLAALGAAVSAGSLARVWQMLLKAYDEVRRAPDPAAATEMAIVRLAYASDLPGPEDAIKRLQSGQLSGGAAPTGGGSSGGGPTASSSNNVTAFAAVQPRAVAVAATEALASPQSFEEVVALIAARRDIGLRMDVERFVRLVSFKPGAIEFEPAPRCPPDLARRISGRLKEWTGQRWLVAAQGGGGGESAYERETREKTEIRAAIDQDPFVLDIKRAFPGAEVTDVKFHNLEAAPAPNAGTTADADDDED
jgi:DNA polymerase-3 subunit gamma/tau